MWTSGHISAKILAMTRKPAVAYQFYPGESAALKKTIESLTGQNGEFSISEFGPQKVEVKKTDISIIVGELETKVTNLKEQLAIEKKLLSELIAQNPQIHPPARCCSYRDRLRIPVAG